ncbi:MAG: wax ester/triacylglycerol synthase family O-acyltransferase [Actinomycetota bacterium]|nr:wax ester/triacylglycerol synthase family O-acyltransferase [Actinomycetota bacterium]
MRRLAGMDASFYYMETPSAHMHVVGTLVLDPTDAPGGYSFAKVRHLLESRLHLLEPFRRRLVPVPFDLDHPVWIEDPDFDLDDHLHRIGAPAPGTMHELAEIVGDIAGRPLDHNRPLWEMWVVENMSEGRIALVSKMHHCAMDGVTGADLMVHLFDLEIEAADPESPAEPWVPEPVPSDNELIADALRARVTDPLRSVRAIGRAGRSMAGAARSILPTIGRGGDGMQMARPFSAPRTPFNGAVSRHRAVAFGEAPFADLHLVKTAFGTTINDVVLAACAVTMRSWLADHGGVPDEPLVASIPVSVHAEDNTEVTNQVAAMLVELPTHLDDPVEQLTAVHAATVDAKEMQSALGAGMLQDMAELMPGALFNRASRLYSSLRLADRHPPMHSLVISNIPGPPVPLYSAGARVLGVYPFGPLLEGAGINITVLSNMGTMNFGVIADRDTVPDVWDIADGFGQAISALRQAAADGDRADSPASRR